MTRNVELTVVPCAFCHGTGVDPFNLLSDRSVCGACGGQGHVRVAAVHVPCPHCRGTGAIKTFRCTVCDGKGAIPPLPEPTIVCPECQGTGDDSSNAALDCLMCDGRGRVRGVPEAVAAS